MHSLALALLALLSPGKPPTRPAVAGKPNRLPTARAPKPTFKVSIDRYSLRNGLHVILHEDHRQPTVVVDLWVRVGSKDERIGRTGFAHLFEHLMFMGTKNVPDGQFDTIMEAAGGSNNASTSEDRTNYFETGPSNLLETFLWLEADRLSTLADSMTKEKVDLQRDVVKNERRQSYENRPYGRAELALPEHLYPVDHPYHHPVIGSHADLTAASVDDVKQFFHEYYVPSNASLVVAGDFQKADARKLVEKYFAWMPKGREPPHSAPKPAALKTSERVTVPDAVKLDQVTLVWHSPASYAPGDAECELLAAILGGGKSSRLYRALVYGKKLAQTVEVEQRTSRYDSQLAVVATAQPGHTAAELEQAIEAELAAFKKAPPTERELGRARAYAQTQQLHAIESLFGLADALNAFEFRFGDAGQLEKRLLARFEPITRLQVARVGQSVLGRPHLTIYVVPVLPVIPSPAPIGTPEGSR